MHILHGLTFLAVCLKCCAECYGCVLLQLRYCKLKRAAVTAQPISAHRDAAPTPFLSRAQPEPRQRVLCSCDVASSSALLWEGVMGSPQPAALLKNLQNCPLRL